MPNRRLSTLPWLNAIGLMLSVLITQVGAWTPILKWYGGGPGMAVTLAGAGWVLLSFGVGMLLGVWVARMLESGAGAARWIVIVLSVDLVWIALMVGLSFW